MSAKPGILNRCGVLVRAGVELFAAALCSALGRAALAHDTVVASAGVRDARLNERFSNGRNMPSSCCWLVADKT